MKNYEITICLGSSCFSRGNKDITQMIKVYLSENNLEDKVKFRGGHCFSECSKGPNLKINDKLFSHVSVDNLIEILESNLDIK